MAVTGLIPKYFDLNCNKTLIAGRSYSLTLYFVLIPLVSILILDLSAFTVGDWLIAKSEGNRVILQCKLPNSVPLPTFKWYKEDSSATNGKRALQSSSHYTIMSNGDLHFAYLRQSDAGSYTCTVTNSLLKKSVSRTVTLTVKKGKQYKNHLLNDVQVNVHRINFTLWGKVDTNFLEEHNFLQTHEKLEN